MNHFPHGWGRPRDDVYGAYEPSYLQTKAPNTHSQGPVVTGSSVVAVKFNGGIAIAADNLASYGSQARYTDMKRLHVFDDTSVVAFSGDVADMQYIVRLMDSLDISEHHMAPDEHSLDAKNLHKYLSKVMYNRRSKLDPLWNHMLVAGLDGDRQPFLGSVDLLGTTFTSPHIATGFGAYIATPILRRHFPEGERPLESITKEEAVNALKECMKVLFYRDARSWNVYSIATVTKDGVDVKNDEKVENQSWGFATGVRGYGRTVD